MKAVYKYPLEITDEQVVNMPLNAKILCVQIQRSVPCLWVEVNTEETEFEERKIYIHGTGHEYEEEGSYIGTIQLYDGRLVFHVFEEKGGEK